MKHIPVTWRLIQDRGKFYELNYYTTILEYCVSLESVVARTMKSMKRVSISKPGTSRLTRVRSTDRMIYTVRPTRSTRVVVYASKVCV